MTGLASVAAAALVALHAGAPYLVKRGTLQREVTAQLRSTTGLALTTRQARFDLLPRPRVIMSGVHVSDPTGSVVLDAPRLVGDVRLLPLVVGRVELASVSLEAPHLALDLDGQPMTPDNTLGRAVRRRAVPADGSDRRLGIVTFTAGTVSVVRHAGQVMPALTEVNATLDWRDLDAAATLTGSFDAAGVAVELAAWIAQPARLVQRDRSSIVLRLHSAPLDLSANGALALGAAPNFKGRVIAAAPSLAALVALACPEIELPAPFANASLEGDATLRLDAVPALDLQKFAFHADGNGVEGTLAYVGGARPLVAGTLATTALSLAPFLARAPAATDGAHHWSASPFGPVRLGTVDLDLRVSATRLRIASAAIDDAALSVMTRGDRLEVGLNEGKAYGGALKGRVSVGAAAEGVNLRAAAVLTGADLATLGWDVFGRQVATGTLSASAGIDSGGDSVAALMRNAQGWARSRATDGDLLGFGSARRDGPPLLRGARTPFESLSLAARIVDGTVVLDEGAMRSPDAATNLSGTVDLGARRLDLRARVHAPNAPDARLDIGGGFDDVSIGAAPDGAASGGGAPP